VLDRIWPADLLEEATGETAPLADYLKRDLLRIAESANEKLAAVDRAGLSREAREAVELRVINVARAFAVLRVESTVRHFRREPLGLRPDLLAVHGPPTRSAARVAPDSTRHEDAARENTPRDHSAPDSVGPDHVAPLRESLHARRQHATPVTTEPVPDLVPDPVLPVEADPSPPPAPATEFGWNYPDTVDVPPLVMDAEPVRKVDVAPAAPDSTYGEAKITSPAVESAEQRVKRLMRYVARQEPGLRWGACDRDGATLLVTDLAYGWIPPGIHLPPGVELLAPQRRDGTVATFLHDTVVSALYAPGESLGGISRSEEPTTPSDTPRLLYMPDDLGAQLVTATQGRTGLPRLTHALAAAVADGAAIPEAEIDVLRVHLDTARYQLLGSYPGLDQALLLNCLLLAATEAIATGDPVAANYRFAWFRALSDPGPIGGTSRSGAPSAR
jgi:hypothetical protein